MLKNLFILSLSFVSFNSIYANDDLEVLCSKALLSEMQKQKLISNSSGVCVQSLTDLPQVNIGLGSSVYSSGVASGKSIGNEDEKIKSISQILTGKSLSQNKFEIYGYADGENNTIPSYTDQFLGAKKTFKKSDIRNLIKDQATRSQILSLLEDTDEKTELQPVKSAGAGQSFKKEDGVTYHPKIERVMSLINNYYLSIDRAIQTCMQLVDGEYATPELAKSNCVKKVTGHASPHSEVLSQGKITCDARRKAVLVLNPGVKATKSTEPSKVQPNFQIPNEGESRRDMQIAASLDLLKKIKSASVGGGTDPNSVIDKLASDCSGSPVDGAAYGFNKDNLKRMYDDIQRNLSAISDQKLKAAVLGGDYAKVKTYLEKSEDDLADGLVTTEDATQKLMGVLNFGVDSKESTLRVKFYYSGTKVNVSLTCKPINDVDLKEFNFDGSVVKVHECWDVENNKKSNFQRLVFDPRNKTKAHKLVLGSNRKYRKDDTPLAEISYGDPSYPKASRDYSSTDVFNCLSASAAVEEKLNHQNQTGAGGELIDPYDLYADASGNVKVSINPKDIPVHERTGEDPVKGWVCDKCHSGLHVKQDDKQNYSTSKKSRDFTMIEGGSHSQSSAPVSSIGLTFGSMKNLGFRKVTRESFDGRCASPNKVCDCLKNSSQYGGLDKILKSSKVVNLNKNLRADMPMTTDDMKNSCLYTPPVAPSCSVAPSGKGSESVNRGLTAPSCLALNRLLAKYPDRKSSIDKTYPKIEDFIRSHQKVKLGSMLCKNAFPSDDDSNDCPGSGSSNKASASPSKGNGQ